ncbi:MAG: hypothetical protein ACQEXB_13225 [Bacillota bacterium]
MLLKRDKNREKEKSFKWSTHKPGALFIAIRKAVLTLVVDFHSKQRWNNTAKIKKAPLEGCFFNKNFNALLLASDEVFHN